MAEIPRLERTIQLGSGASGRFSGPMPGADARKVLPLMDTRFWPTDPLMGHEDPDPGSRHPCPDPAGSTAYLISSMRSNLSAGKPRAPAPPDRGNDSPFRRARMLEPGRSIPGAASIGPAHHRGRAARRLEREHGPCLHPAGSSRLASPPRRSTPPQRIPRQRLPGRSRVPSRHPSRGHRTDQLPAGLRDHRPLRKPTSRSRSDPPGTPAMTNPTRPTSCRNPKHL